MQTFQGFLRIVFTMVQSGLYINERTKSGDTPLLISVRKERLAVAKYLIENGADVNLANYAGYTPLHFAAKVQSWKWTKKI